MTRNNKREMVKISPQKSPLKWTQKPDVESSKSEINHSECRSMSHEPANKNSAQSDHGLMSDRQFEKTAAGNLISANFCTHSLSWVLFAFYQIRASRRRMC